MSLGHLWGDMDASNSQTFARGYFSHSQLIKITHSLSKSLAFCKFESVNFKPCRRIRRILQISEGVQGVNYYIHLGLSASVDNTLLDLQNSSHPTQLHSITAKYIYIFFQKHLRPPKEKKKMLLSINYEKWTTVWVNYTRLLTTINCQKSNLR